MLNRTTAWGLIALIFAALAGAATAQAQVGDPTSRGCATTDTACRLDGLERRLDYLIDLTERNARPDRPGRSSSGRSIDIPVNQSCGMAPDGCSALAARLCSAGGFARGVPAETTASSFTTTLVRATCLE